MWAYDKFWDNVSIQKTLDNARKREIEAAHAAKQEAEKAVAEAKAEAEEAKEKMLDAARTMKAKGYALEDIAEITGLTIEQIGAL